VLRDVFWPKCDEITEDWRKLHMGDLHDLYSTNIIWVIKGGDGLDMWHMRGRREIYAEFW